MTFKSVIGRAMAETLKYAELRMSGGREMAREWSKRSEALPDLIIQTLFDAGYVIVPVGGMAAVNVDAAFEDFSVVFRASLNLNEPLIVKCRMSGRMPDVDRGGSAYLDHIAGSMMARMLAEIRPRHTDRLRAELQQALSKASNRD